MARKIIIEDDLTGEEGAEERNFVLADTAYQADLTDESWNWFLDVLGPLLEASRMVGQRRGDEIRKLGTPRKVTMEDQDERHSRSQLNSIREWANANRLRLPAGGGKIAAVMWQAWALQDVALVPEKYKLAEGEENGAVAQAVGRRGLDTPEESEQQELAAAGA